MKTIEKISPEEINNISHVLNEIILYSIEQRGFVNLFANFLEQSLSVSNYKSIDERLSVINFLDKMNRYREFQMIQNGQLNIIDLEKTAERFGKKAQSGFETFSEE